MQQKWNFMRLHCRRDKGECNAPLHGFFGGCGTDVKREFTFTYVTLGHWKKELLHGVSWMMCGILRERWKGERGWITAPGSPFFTGTIFCVSDDGGLNPSIYRTIWREMDGRGWWVSMKTTQHTNERHKTSMVARECEGICEEGWDDVANAKKSCCCSTVGAAAWLSSSRLTISYALPQGRFKTQTFVLDSARNAGIVWRGPQPAPLARSVGVCVCANAEECGKELPIQQQQCLVDGEEPTQYHNGHRNFHGAQTLPW